MKGMLFSLSILLLASIMLYLLAIISEEITLLREATNTLSGFERVNAQYDSAYYGMKMIAENNGVNISFSGTNVTLSMNTARIAEYHTEKIAFGQFASAYSDVNTTIDSIDNNTILLHFSPQDINMNYSSSNVTITPKNASRSADSVLSYEVLMIISAPTPAINWTNKTELSQADPNSIYVRAAIQGTNGTVYAEKYLDRYENSQLDFLNTQNASIISVEMNSPAALYVRYNLDTYLKIIVGLDSEADVEMRDVTLNIKLS